MSYFDSSALAALGSAGAQQLQAQQSLGDLAVKTNPNVAYAEGRIKALTLQHLQTGLDIQQSTLDATIAQRAVENEMAKHKADLDTYQITNQVANAKAELELRRKELAEKQAEFQQSFGLQAEELGLKKAALPTDIAYKQALIEASNYSKDPSNPDNLFKLAKISQMFNKGVKAQSPQGKLAQDLSAGLVTTDQLAKMQTTFDPVTGQAITSYNPNASGNAGLTKEGLIDAQKKDNESLKTIREDATAALRDLNQFGNLRANIEQFGDTGPLYGKAKLLASQAGAMVDIPGAQQLAASGEAVRGLGNLGALVNRKNMPGQMSDADRNFLIQSAPGLANTKEGNLKLLDISEAQAKMTAQYADFAEQYRAKTGSLVGLNTAWSKYAEANKVISKKGKNIEVKQPSDENLSKFVEKLPSQADLEFTANSYGISVDEVRAKLGLK